MSHQCAPHTVCLTWTSAVGLPVQDWYWWRLSARVSRALCPPGLCRPPFRMGINLWMLYGERITMSKSDRVKPSMQAALRARRQPAVRGGDVELIDGVAHDRLMHRFKTAVAGAGAGTSRERRRQRQSRPSCDLLHHFAPENQRVT